MRIYLIGMPAAGKSTLGQTLAQALSMDFIDLDRYIEAQAQQSIATIFEQEGETHFRRLEQEALHQLSAQENLLIATGGGTPCFFDNITYMLGQGQVVFLEASLEALAKRIMQKPGRPMFAGLSAEEVQQKLQALYEKRLPFYQQAPIHFKAAEMPLSYLQNLLKQA
jgi:shikimate kinase